MCVCACVYSCVSVYLTASHVECIPFSTLFLEKPSSHHLSWGLRSMLPGTCGWHPMRRGYGFRPSILISTEKMDLSRCASKGSLKQLSCETEPLKTCTMLLSIPRPLSVNVFCSCSTTLVYCQRSLTQFSRNLRYLTFLYGCKGISNTSLLT